MTDEAFIGIDLGTTNCCMGAYINGKVKILRNCCDSKLTPSVVLFHDAGNQTVGEVAKQNAHENPRNTIYDAKRILGRSWDDVKLQKDKEKWPFEVCRKEDVPCIEAVGNIYHPEQISGKILKFLKNQAEQILGKPVTKAVITVPAYFSDAQRQATLDAAKIADLHVLDLLNEPTAAAVAYRMKRLQKRSTLALVYDMGGGTFDVAIVRISSDDIQVLGYDGDTHLGGNDVDQKIVKHFKNKFFEETGIDLDREAKSPNENIKRLAKTSLVRLQGASEEAKINLSFVEKVSLEVKRLRDKDVTFTLTKAEFNDINKHLFSKTLKVVMRALDNARVTPEAIDDIVMVGGSSRIVKLGEILKQTFPKSSLSFNINPMHAVAYGATVHAANLANANVRNNPLQIMDITPMSFGTDSDTGEYIVLLEKGVPVPYKRRKGYKTVADGQNDAIVGIYQGDEEIAKENIFLGTLNIPNIPQNRKGEEHIVVHMEISKMGILHVQAQILSSKEKVELEVGCKQNRLKSSKITDFQIYEKACTVTGFLKVEDTFPAEDFPSRRRFISRTLDMQRPN